MAHHRSPERQPRATRDWPLSAAATQALLNLREDRPATTTPAILVRLAFRELIERGELRPVELRQQRVLGNQILVASSPSGSSAQLPAPLDHLAQFVAPTDGEDLAKVVRKAQRSRRHLYSSELQERSEDELLRQGLAETRTRTVLRLWSRSFLAPTPSGRALAERAVADSVQQTFDDALTAAVHGFGVDHGGDRVVVAAFDAAITAGIGTGGGGG